MSTCVCGHDEADHETIAYRGDKPRECFVCLKLPQLHACREFRDAAAATWPINVKSATVLKAIRHPDRVFFNTDLVYFNTDLLETPPNFLPYQDTLTFEVRVPRDSAVNFLETKFPGLPYHVVNINKLKGPADDKQNRRS